MAILIPAEGLPSVFVFKTPDLTGLIHTTTHRNAHVDRDDIQTASPGDLSGLLPPTGQLCLPHTTFIKLTAFSLFLKTSRSASATTSALDSSAPMAVARPPLCAFLLD